MSGRLRCKPNNRELRCEAAAGRGSKNGTKWDDALEPGRSSRRYLLACGARVHVDFHANRHLNDLRCFPGHQRTPSSRHGCRINMVRPHRKGRKPASTKHPWGRIFANWDACLSSGCFHFNTPGLGARETPSATTGIKNTMQNGGERQRRAASSRRTRTARPCSGIGGHAAATRMGRFLREATERVP